MYCLYSPKHFAIAGVLGMALLSPATSTVYAAQTMAKTSVAVSDSTLQDRAEAAIKAQPTLKNQDVDVKVDNKVVTLTGSVLTATRKARAGRAARVAGVTSVVNNLKVDPHATQNVAEKAGEATKTAAVKTGDAVKTAGEKTKDGLSKTGEVITDAWLNTKVHSNMMNEPLLKDSEINVDVKDHIVTLRGMVTSTAGKTRAGDIAKTTEGVKGVNNTLVVGPKKSS
jgi:hyperosmotically inducible periplasmic protein